MKGKSVKLKGKFQNKSHINFLVIQFMSIVVEISLAKSKSGGCARKATNFSVSFA